MQSEIVMKMALLSHLSEKYATLPTCTIQFDNPSKSSNRISRPLHPMAALSI